MIEIYNYDKSWITDKEQKTLTRTVIGKQVRVFYNYRGRERNFYGILRSMHGDEIEIEQKKQTVYLRLPNVIALFLE